MCGIAGMLYFPKERDLKMLQHIKVFYNQLLTETMERGKDATGVAIMRNNAEYYMQKSGTKANDAIYDPENLNKFLSLLDCDDISHVMGHCRALSKGTATNNLNNHPIETNGEIIGIHNGTFKNEQDDAIFELIGEEKRKGTVDSEAIFELINFLMEENESLNKDGIELSDILYEIVLNVASNLDSSFAFSVMHKRLPNQIMMARNPERPIVLAKIPSWGIVVYASEEKHIYNAIAQSNYCYAVLNNEVPSIDAYMSEVPNNTVLRIIADKEMEDDSELNVRYQTFIPYKENIEKVDDKNNTTEKDKKDETKETQPNLPIKETKKTNENKDNKENKEDKNNNKKAKKENIKQQKLHKTAWDIAFKAIITRIKNNTGPCFDNPTLTIEMAKRALSDKSFYYMDEEVIERGIRATEILSYAYGFVEGLMIGKFGKQMYFPKSKMNSFKDIDIVDDELMKELKGILPTDFEQPAIEKPMITHISKFGIAMPIELSDFQFTKDEALPVETTELVYFCQKCDTISLKSESITTIVNGITSYNCRKCNTKLAEIKTNIIEPDKDESEEKELQEARQ